MLPWSSHLTFPHLHFLICKMGETTWLGKVNKAVHLKFWGSHLSARATPQLHPPSWSSWIIPAHFFHLIDRLSRAFGEMITNKVSIYCTRGNTYQYCISVKTIDFIKYICWLNILKRVYKLGYSQYLWWIHTQKR